MDTNEVLKLAKLARIRMSEKEAEELKDEFKPILNYVGEVKNALPKSAKKASRKFAVTNVMREDENPHEGDAYTEDLLNAAPKREGRFIKVKKIL